MGRPLNRSDHQATRWRKVILLAFGQKKMFKKFIPAFLHLIIYLGFIIINMEVLEFTIDGITGKHRSIARLLYESDKNLTGYSLTYNYLMNIFEFLAVGVIIACIIFLVRRNILKIKRFSGTEMRSWPHLDANLILVFEILLMLAILSMNAADQLLQNLISGYTSTGPLFFSRFLIGSFVRSFNPTSLVILERSAWWFHILGILGFAIYVTYSKHLHIIMAFPNTYYSNLRPPGEIPIMEEVSREVRSILGLVQDHNESQSEISRLGARDVQDLTWKNLMDAYTCTECGRCTSVCPAHITGKKLSPRKIIMNVRDRIEEITRKSYKVRQEVDKSLFDYISGEEIFACTTCNACIEACPVSIDPVSVILQMRRYTALEVSTSPPQWNIMFSNIETSFAPWKFPSADRFKWAEEIKNS